jgi:hypothetical protein
VKSGVDVGSDISSIVGRGIGKADLIGDRMTSLGVGARHVRSGEWVIYWSACSKT